MYILKKIFCITIFLNTILLFSYQTKDNNNNNDLKAHYIYNLINYIKKQGGNTSFNNKSFNICIEKNIPLTNSLKKFDKTIVKDKKINIYNITNTQNYIDYCNMIILPKLSDKKLQKILKKAKEKSIITISDIKDCTKKGVMIYLKDLQFRIVFDINLKAVKDADIKLSSRLLKLSNIINE